jgi:hypothetical protein
MELEAIRNWFISIGTQYYDAFFTEQRYMAYLEGLKVT